MLELDECKEEREEGKKARETRRVRSSLIILLTYLQTLSSNTSVDSGPSSQQRWRPVSYTVLIVLSVQPPSPGSWSLFGDEDYEDRSEDAR